MIQQELWNVGNQVWRSKKITSQYFVQRKNTFAKLHQMLLAVGWEEAPKYILLPLPPPEELRGSTIKVSNCLSEKGSCNKFYYSYSLKTYHTKWCKGIIMIALHRDREAPSPLFFWGGGSGKECLFERTKKLSYYAW